jgi:hypothetical protein
MHTAQQYQHAEELRRESRELREHSDQLRRSLHQFLRQCEDLRKQLHLYLDQAFEQCFYDAPHREVVERFSTVERS